MGKKIILSLFALLSIVSVCIFSRFLYKKSWFSDTTLTSEIDPFDVFTLIVSTGITVWLGIYVSKKITTQRYEKEYIIKDLQNIENEINSIERDIRSDYLDLQKVFDKLNTIKLYVDRFSSTVSIFKVTNINSEKLIISYKNLYKKTTNTESDKLDLNDSNRKEINKICDEFICQIRKFIFVINKK